MNDEAEKRFVDTNILVYAHDATAGPKHDRALSLVRELWRSRAGCISIQILQEFYVTITRKVPYPLKPDAAYRIIRSLSRWQVHSPNAHDVLRAIEIHQRYGISFWDAMVVRSAQALGCRVILSEDLSSGTTYEEALAVNPFQ